ncbi:hypothetical protein AB3R30_17735 [Leptolyngbyaceae cyanobacterium UHCC 1019]
MAYSSTFSSSTSLLNRFALAGFIFCYWLMYLDATGHQVEQPTIAATPAQPTTEEAQAATPAIASVIEFYKF